MLLISGMRDSGCRERVAAALEGVRGVREVHVSLFRARATVVHEASCAETALVRSVADAGYGASAVAARTSTEGRAGGPGT